MTVEIRELVIQAKVTTRHESGATRAIRADSASERIREERLIQSITRRVIEQLRDHEWGRK